MADYLKQNNVDMPWNEVHQALFDANNFHIFMFLRYSRVEAIREIGTCVVTRDDDGDFHELLLKSSNCISSEVG